MVSTAAVLRSGEAMSHAAVFAVLAIVMVCCTCCQGCHDEERKALLEISRQTSALPDWGGAAGGEDDCCRWGGVTCDNHTGHVVQLDLCGTETTVGNGWYSNLTSLGQFQELEKLDLCSSGVVGALPDVVLCDLKKLEWLRLRTSSWFNRRIPLCLCDMSSLTMLDLSLNALQANIPPCLGNLRSLTELHLSGNWLQGSIPPGLCNMSSLITLDLASNYNLQGNIPPCLCNKSSLTVLDLSMNQFQGNILSCLSNLTSLTQLGLSFNELQGDILTSLCSLHSLTSLDLASNQFQGNIPPCLANLHNLQKLDLGINEFKGSIPPSIFPNLTKLEFVRVGGDRDRLEGTFLFSAFANTSNLNLVDMSSRYGLKIETESPSSWVPSFQLGYLSISHCTLNSLSGRIFPSFISTQRKLYTLFLKDTSIEGTIPLWLLCNSSLWSLDLRLNMFHGTFKIPCLNTSSSVHSLDLSHNQIHGSLPTDVPYFIPSLRELFVAGNELGGTIPPSLGQSTLLKLDLSDNYLSGTLPQTLTTNQTILIYLNVSHNLLEGEMLPVDLDMPRLEHLYLHNNRFTGSIPSKLSNCSSLKSLNVAHNKLVGNLSCCLPTFPSMIVLSLRENLFQGNLPSHICQMQHLRILDLSGNNLSGNILPCLNNISFWKSSSLNLTAFFGHRRPAPLYDFYEDDIVYFISKNLLLSYQGEPLELVTGLDLSSNQLDGIIPWDIGELRWLMSLNLSNNYLEGPLPASLGNMERLESLDLSHNNLSGTIPHEMVRLHFLSTYSVAFNNLAGIIPYEQQFASFSKDSYEGNPGLCGLPLEKNCSSNKDAVQPPQDQKEDEKNPGLFDKDVVFYSFIIASFAFGFWSFMATLIFNQRWRIRYFEGIDRYFDFYLRRF